MRLFVPAMLLGLLLVLGAAFVLWPLLTPVARFVGGPAEDVDATAAAAVLRDLDDCFNCRDADRYVDTFAFDDEQQRELLRAHLRQLFAGAPLQRHSELRGGMQRIGKRSAAFVLREYRRDAQAAEPDATDAVWLVLGKREGKAVPTAVVDAGSSECRDPLQPFRCPACNYQVGGVDGWLCVPGRPDRAEALEALTFALLGTDVRCDVDVAVGDETLAAAAVATTMATDLRRLLPGARLMAVEPWLPPSLAAAAPPQVSGAALRLDLPDGTANLLHVLCLGALRHTLSVRGRPRSLAAAAPAIAALLASYQMLQTDADLALAAARPIQAHQGSVVNGGSYQNALYRLHCDGPADWRLEARASGAAFSAAWTCPRQTGRMYLNGYLPPPGLPHWLPADADAWLEDLCQRAGLQIDRDHAGEWCDDDRPLQVRQVVLLPRQVSERQPARRLLQLVLRPDLLVVLDGYVAKGTDEERLRQAFTSLKTE